MFSERLKQLRRNRGITQVQLAHEFNVANGTIAMWETGKREPDFATTIRIATFFQVTTDYLLGNERNLMQDECSKLFRHNLSIALEQLDNAFSGVTEAEYDYYKLQELVESTYPLTVKEAEEAAGTIGVPLHDLFREDYIDYLMGFSDDPTPVKENKKIPPLEQGGLSEAELHLISLYRELNQEGQEKLLDYADDLIMSKKYIKSDSTKLDKARGA